MAKKIKFHHFIHRMLVQLNHHSGALFSAWIFVYFSTSLISLTKQMAEVSLAPAASRQAFTTPWSGRRMTKRLSMPIFAPSPSSSSSSSASSSPRAPTSCTTPSPWAWTTSRDTIQHGREPSAEEDQSWTKFEQNWTI